MKYLFCAVLTGAAASLISEVEAAVWTVRSEQEFQSSWTAAQPGDTIELKGDVDLSGIEWGEPKGGRITVSSDSGVPRSFTWNNPPSDVALPENMVLEGVNVAGSPGVALRGRDLIIGQSNHWQNNNGAIEAEKTLEVGAANRWEDNVRLGNGGAVLVQAGGKARIAAGNVFENNHAVGDGVSNGLGGAVRLEENAELTLEAGGEGGDIVFRRNTSGAQRRNGIVTPGLGNDISIAAGGKLVANADKGSRIALESGLASDDASALVVKEGAGRLILGELGEYAGSLDVRAGSLELAEKAVLGSPEATGADAAVRVSPGACLDLHNGSVLYTPLDMENGSLIVSGSAAVLAPRITLSGDNTWTFRPTSAQIAGRRALLSLSPAVTLARSGPGALTLNLDMRGVTSLQNRTSLNVVNLAEVQDADTRAQLSHAGVSVTDARGTRETGRHLENDGTFAVESGTTAPGGLPGSGDDHELIRFDRPGASVVHALWSSAGALHAFVDSTRYALPRAGESPRGMRWHAQGLGHTDSLSGAYRYSGGGYAVGLHASAGAHGVVGLTVGQMFGTNHARLDAPESDARAAVKQNELMAVLRARCEIPGNERSSWAVEADLAYGYTDNDCSTERSAGSWSDNNFAAGARVIWQYRQAGGLQLAPFIGLEWLRGRQGSIDMRGATAWRGKGAEMTILSLPAGLSLARPFEGGMGETFTPRLDILYRGDLVQNAPDLTATDGYASWNVRSVKPGRHALEARALLHAQYTPAWGAYIGGGVEARRHRTEARASAGVIYTF